MVLNYCCIVSEHFTLRDFGLIRSNWVVRIVSILYWGCFCICLSLVLPAALEGGGGISCHS